MEHEILSLGRKIFTLKEENNKRKRKPGYGCLKWQLCRLDKYYKCLLKKMGECKEIEINTTSRLFGYRIKLDDLKKDMVDHAEKAGMFHPHKYAHFDLIARELDDIESYKTTGTEYTDLLNEYIAHLKGMCAYHKSLQQLFDRRCHRIKCNMELTCNPEEIYKAKKEMWKAYYLVHDAIVCHERDVLVEYRACEHPTEERSSSPDSRNSEGYSSSEVEEVEQSPTAYIYRPSSSSSSSSSSCGEDK